MKRRAGRPPGTNNRVQKSFRFRREFAALIAKIAAREHLSQVRVIEAALSRYGKEIAV